MQRYPRRHRSRCRLRAARADQAQRTARTLEQSAEQAQRSADQEQARADGLTRQADTANRRSDTAQRTLAGLESGLQQQSRFNPTPATVGRLVDAFA
jgi:hypothetical protein